MVVLTKANDALYFVQRDLIVTPVIKAGSL
jgi:hypothetical protein